MNNTKSISTQPPPQTEAVEITDSAELQRLWEEYFYNGITTICNTDEFSSPEETNPVYIAQYCWYNLNPSEKGTCITKCNPTSLLILLNITV